MNNKIFNFVLKYFAFGFLIGCLIVDLIMNLYGITNYINSSVYIILMGCFVVERCFYIRDIILDEIEQTQRMILDLQESKTKDAKTKNTKAKTRRRPDASLN